MEQPAGWSALSRADRIARLRAQDADLDRRIRARLSGLSVEYLGGTRSWTVRGAAELVARIREKIMDLPVQIAPDVTFRAI